MTKSLWLGVLLTALCVPVFSQQMHGRYAVRPLKEAPRGKEGIHALSSAAVATVPLWTGQDGTYPYTMVGADPTNAANNSTTTIPVVIVPITFQIGTSTFNPTTSNSCNSTSASSLTLSSPLFNNTSFSVGGTNAGSTQYIDYFQRANFWSFTGPSGINPNYHLMFSASQANNVTVSVPAASGRVVPAPCGTLGEIDINWFDAYLQSTLFPQLASQSITPSTIPVFLLNNVVLYETTTANCCIIGYHSALNNASFSNTLQVYLVADFDTSSTFSEGDASALSHEFGELVDDPTGSNSTPAWGNIGQVSGCQTSLEAGDPMTGTVHSITMSNGHTYQVQEMAFKSWFFHDSPSTGINGYYSNFGTFTKSASVCGNSATTLQVSPTTLSAGQAATVTITVVPANGATGTPTGTVTLYDSLSTTALGNYALVNGTLSFTNTTLPAGSYYLYANYSGDATFSVSTSNQVNVTVGSTAMLTPSPTALTFLSTVAGSSTSLPVTLSNSGTSAVTITSFSFSGAAPGDFTQTNNCAGSVGAGKSCTVTVSFKPQATGTRTATMTINDNAANSPQSVSLTGTGASAGTPAPQFTPTSLSFGNQNVGTASAAKAITLKNGGTASLTGIVISISGTNAGDFSQKNNCTTSLAAGATCTINVTFNPAAGGARSAAVSVGDNATGSPQTVPLSGTGVITAPAVTLTPTSINFGNQPVGSASKTPLTVQLSNTGTAPLTGIAFSFTGTNPGDFSQTNNCGTSVAAGASCTIKLTFKPTAGGARSASLSVKDNAANSPQAVALSGTGVLAAK